MNWISQMFAAPRGSKLYAYVMYPDSVRKAMRTIPTRAGGAARVIKKENHEMMTTMLHGMTDVQGAEHSRVGFEDE